MPVKITQRRTAMALALLLRARAKIADDRAWGICYALSLAAQRGREEFHLADEMRAEVMAALHPQVTFDEWLYVRGRAHSSEATKVVRLRWLDAWIEAHRAALKEK